ncbi:MAG: hypothetical protein DMF63_00450 [Acidobacteria bacterium]|nr:MAG: hypothetical protein DMF63_00450 [Acidobacteriota bacterium]
MKRIYFLIFALGACAAAASAQPRPVGPAAQLPSSPHTLSTAPAPTSFEAKYEGGMFGFSKKEEGMLKFDDENQRLVFIGKDNIEKFHIPYDAVVVVYPQSKSVTSTTGNVVKNLPLPGAMLGGLIKEKRSYLIVHFEDPDIEAARGIVNFKLGTKELLDSVIQSLAGKADLAQRGDAFYRPKKG